MAAAKQACTVIECREWGGTTRRGTPVGTWRGSSVGSDQGVAAGMGKAALGGEDPGERTLWAGHR